MAVHTILYAIANNPRLQAEMIIKGGILLALRYNSPRYTTDVDFSTSLKYSEFNQDEFEAELGASLAMAVETLNYGLDCRLQSIKINPSRPDATFPTLIARIGYADKSDLKKHRRLLRKNALDVVKVEYSFNEITPNIEHVRLARGGELSVYGLRDLIAEKYRAILQQEVRNRIRRQDVYDLFFLFNSCPTISPGDKKGILDSLLIKSESRSLSVGAESMRSEEIMRRTRKEYQLLKQEIIGELPDFDEVYSVVQRFYELLPWE